MFPSRMLEALLSGPAQCLIGYFMIIRMLLDHPAIMVKDGWPSWMGNPYIKPQRQRKVGKGPPEKASFPFCQHVYQVSIGVVVRYTDGDGSDCDCGL